jgi:hypothetical protein
MKDYIFALQKDGFYQITNAPDIDELKKYYAEKYWQEVTGFKSELSETEKSYIENTMTLKAYFNQPATDASWNSNSVINGR